jgi:hypothetical protein
MLLPSCTRNCEPLKDSVARGDQRTNVRARRLISLVRHLVAKLEEAHDLLPKRVVLVLQATSQHGLRYVVEEIDRRPLENPRLSKSTSRRGFISASTRSARTARARDSQAIAASRTATPGLGSAVQIAQ